MRFLAAVLLLSLPSSAAAQEFPQDYRQFLLPLTAGAVPGANGSLWTTEWTVLNGTNERLFLGGPFPFVNFSPVITDNDIEPRATKRMVVAEAVPGLDGAFVYVPAGDVDEVEMSLRVRDVSVSAQSYGTSIPIVPIEDFEPRVRLIDVPTDPAYRSMLRIYGATAEPQPVRVAIYDPRRGTPLEEVEVLLQPTEYRGIVEHVPGPAYAQLDPLSEAVRAAVPKVRIEVTSAAGAPVWAFVSISHNETQQVTTVVPW